MSSYPGKKSKVSVGFGIHGFNCDPDEITKVLRVKPSKVLRKGVLYEGRKIKQRHNMWKLDSALLDETDADAHVKSLLKKLKRVPELKKKLKKIQIGMNCVVYFIGDDSSPCLVLSERSIKGLADIGCGFGIDYYIFPKGWEKKAK